MLIHTEMIDLPQLSPRGLVIGSFDGVHLGHRLLFKRARELISPKGTLGALSFINHPSQVLKRGPPALLICSKDHKIKLLEEAGIQELFLIEFTPEFAAQTYEEFLTNLKKSFPFDFLIRGKGSTLGKSREGNEIQVAELGKKLQFQSEYLENLKIADEVVSSRKIREFIQNGNFEKAKQLLGRPYSIYGLFEIDTENTLQGSLPVHNLCLPPVGTYEVLVKQGIKITGARAHLQKKAHEIKLSFVHTCQEFAGLNIEILFGET